MNKILNNGVEMPKLGLGVFRLKDKKEATDSVLMAIKSGYRSIDTATIYENEQMVGEAIRESGINRRELFITTKVWNEVQRTGNVAQAFDESLKLLGLDYIDLYLIHWPVKEKFVQTYLELEKIYKSGKVRAIGVSNFHEHHLDEIKKVWSVVPAVNQVECHPYLSQISLQERCVKEGIAMEAWSPLAAAKNDLLSNPVITTIANKHGKSPAQIVLRWFIERDIIVIPKSSNEVRIKENIDIFNFKLSKEEMDSIFVLNRDEHVGSSPDNFDF